MARTVLIASTLALSAAVFTACDEKPAAAPKAAPAPSTGQPAPSHGTGHGGAVIELGSAKAGPFSLRATRDEGVIKAGGEAPIDVRVDPAPESGAKVAAVRFWIGTSDAQGSIKAKADIEDPKEPNRWHTHAEVPDPLPAGSQLWVEVESDKGEKSSASFDLKI